MNPPDCPKCQEQSLEHFRADVRGLVWYQCKTCKKMVLVDNGRVAHITTD